MNFIPTDYAPGTVEKIDLLRARAEAELPLWHPLDRNDCRGLKAGDVPVTQKSKRSVAMQRSKIIMSKNRKALSE